MLTLSAPPSTAPSSAGRSHPSRRSASSGRNPGRHREGARGRRSAASVDLHADSTVPMMIHCYGRCSPGAAAGRAALITCRHTQQVHGESVSRPNTPCTVIRRARASTPSWVPPALTREAGALIGGTVSRPRLINL